MITLVAGMQGAGKSLYSVYLAKKYLKLKRDVFSNSYIKNCYILPLDWYNYQYKSGTLIILDESQLNYNCRDYSTKDKQIMYKKILTYLTMCRHYNIEIVFITQSINRLDVQIRDLATDIFRFRNTIKFPIIYFDHKKIKIKNLPILQKRTIF